MNRIFEVIVSILLLFCFVYMAKVHAQYNTVQARILIQKLRADDFQKRIEALERH